MTELASHGVDSTFVVRVQIPGEAPVEHRFRGETLTIGAAPDNDLVVAAAGVAARHLRVRAAGREFLICSLAEGSATRLGGGALAPGEEYRLREGQEVAIGRATLTFEAVLDVDVVELDAPAGPADPAGRVLRGERYWGRSDWTEVPPERPEPRPAAGSAASVTAAATAWRGEPPFTDRHSPVAAPRRSPRPARVPPLVRVLQVVGGLIFFSALIFGVVLALL